MEPSSAIIPSWQWLLQTNSRFGFYPSSLGLEGLSGRSDAAVEVFLLGLGFGADGEGGREIEAECEVEGCVMATAKVALAENLHADDAFARGAHLAHDADYSIWIGIHESAHRVDANEVDLDPGRFCGGAKGFDAVAGAAMSANNAFFLGFGEDIHHALEALSPITLCKAMHQADIDVIGAKFAAETIEIGTGGGSVARPGLGEDGDFIAGHVFEGFGNVWMAAIGVGGADETQAVVVAVQQHVPCPLTPA